MPFIALIIFINRCSSWQRKEAEGAPQQQLPTPTTLMTLRYWQIHPTKPKHYCIVWNEPPQALASMSMHTKLNICASIKQVTFPHKREPLWNRFTYLGSSVWSTEIDIDTQLSHGQLSIIWKSDLIDKMKRSFFQAAFVSILLYGCTTWTLTERLEMKLDGNYTRMLQAILNTHQLYGHLPPHHENYPS